MFRSAGEWAGLASETVSYVIAGGLLGWLADRGFEDRLLACHGFHRGNRDWDRCPSFEAPSK